MKKFPIGTAISSKIENLFEQNAVPNQDNRMSARLVKSAAYLPKNEFIGWQLHTHTTGLVDMCMFASESISYEDMQWIAEEVALTQKAQFDPADEEENNDILYELTLPLHKEAPTIGFQAAAATGTGMSRKWPMSYFHQFAGLVRALRITGGTIRFVAGHADDVERAECKNAVLRTWGSETMSADEYIGMPVRARLLIRLPGLPSLRLRTVLAEDITRIELHRVGTMHDGICAQIWEHPMEGAPVLPNLAARVMMLEPLIVKEQIEGVLSCDIPAKPIFARHEGLTGEGAIEIGQAVATSGEMRSICIGEDDIRRHWQIVGQTGTGKSSLLASTIIRSIEKGYGLTFFDPHGTTIKQVMNCLPSQFADRVRVVHIGDAENPVPLCMWNSDDPDKEEKHINDLCELFMEIFDPHNQGFTGPRWERWFCTFAKASIALLGKNASFESIITLSQSRTNMQKLCQAIEKDYPTLAAVIKDEYCSSKSNDFQDLVNWCVSKLQRVTSIPQLRSTLGAGTNALDFHSTVDTDTVTLIDLASPEIGTHAARIMGTLLLMQFWTAVLGRSDRAKTHLLFLDEAHLFQTNPLPQMLAEGRKFGLGLVIAHQHCGQLRQEVLDALEANSANFTAFRLSPRDAGIAAIKLDDSIFGTYLCRLSQFTAISSLSINGRQTPPFTLFVERIHQQEKHPEVLNEIEERSCRELVWPYRLQKALTPAEILTKLDQSAKKSRRAESPGRNGWTGGIRYIVKKAG